MARYPVPIYMCMWLLTVIVHSSVASNGRQTTVSSRGTNQKPTAAPDFTENVESLMQCVVLCNVKTEDCKSVGYQKKKCHIFKEFHTDLEKAEGYAYWEAKPETTIHYQLFKDKVNFDDASKVCKSKGGILATIHDEETNKEVVNVITKNPTIVDDIWIGLRAKAKEGPFVWSDDVEISPDKKGYWHNWLDKDPDDYKNDTTWSCVRILASNRKNKNQYTMWADTKTCENKYAFLCQTEIY